MFEFIKRSIKLAGTKKNKLVGGIFVTFFQNISLLLSFFAIYLAFKYMDVLSSSNLKNIAFILILAFLFNFLCKWFESYLTSGAFFSIYRDYRLDVGERLKKSKMGYFSEQSLSKILSCLTNILQNLENLSQLTFTFTIAGFAISLFLLLGLFNMSVKIGVITLILLAIAWLFIFLMFHKHKKSVLKGHKANEEFNSALVDGLRGIPVLRSFPMLKEADIDKIHSAVYDSAEKVEKTATELEIIFTIYSRLFETILNLSSLIITLYACYLFTQGEVNIAETLTLSAASFMLFSGLKQLTGASILLVKNPAYLDYLDDVMDIPEIKDGKLTEMQDTKNIEFKHVNFSYSKEKKVIQDLNFIIKEGSKTAIVGPSGSGKTTIINLISRFYDVNSGEILIANNNIKDYEVKTLIKSLSLVFQDVYLFNDTVKNNIKFAKPDATDEEILAVSKKAMCHDFIMDMENGYETIIGEGGSNISGGEKQRISIARALLKDAPIILLDEATSSVDPENEYEILKAIDELCKGKTVVSIAHRLSTVKHADQILVINDGKLSQAGDHNKLIKEDGIYKDFIMAREKASVWKI